MNKKSDTEEAFAQPSEIEAEFKQFASSSRVGDSYAQWKLLGQAANSFKSNNKTPKNPNNSVIHNDLDSHYLPRGTESFLSPKKRTVPEFSGQLYQKSSSLKDLVQSRIDKPNVSVNNAAGLGSMPNRNTAVERSQNIADKIRAQSTAQTNERRQTPQVPSGSVVSTALGQFRTFSETRPSLAFQNRNASFNSDDKSNNSSLLSRVEHQYNRQENEGSSPNTIMDMIKSSPQNGSSQNNYDNSKAGSFSGRNRAGNQNAASIRGLLNSVNGTESDNGTASSPIDGRALPPDHSLSSSRTLKDLIGKNRSLDDKHQAPLSVRQSVETTLRQSEEIWQRKYRGDYSSGYGPERSSLRGHIALRQVINDNDSAKDFLSSHRAERSYGENVYRPARGRYSSLFKGNANAKMSKNNTPENLQDIFRRIESCQ